MREVTLPYGWGLGRLLVEGAPASAPRVASQRSSTLAGPKLLRTSIGSQSNIVSRSGMALLPRIVTVDGGKRLSEAPETQWE